MKEPPPQTIPGEFLVVVSTFTYEMGGGGYFHVDTKSTGIELGVGFGVWGSGF